MPTENEDRQAQQLAAAERRNERDRWSDNAIDREPLIGKRGLRRLLWIAASIVIVTLLVTLPPLVNVSRYQHRVASAIAGSIGRPVRFDSIELHLLPLPGFTIHNFVVMEDGAFGAEPAMRANTVEVRVRVGSLWRRRVEIARIQLQSPTVNLVRNAAGFWNLQGVVQQAAQVQSAPTAQVRAGDAPRFPYIEATDARVNLKLGDTKLPYSLTDATFALFLPEEDAWHLRLAGRPMRTDTDASDVGQLRVEATLARKGNSAQQPFTLQASWKPTPLGEGSKLAVGRDTGWRGSVSAEVNLQGTPAAMRVSTNIHVRDLRRAEFVPAETVDLDAHCEAQAIGVAHALTGVRCALPTATHASLLDELPFFRETDTPTAIAPDVLTLQADVPSVSDLRSATAKVSVAAASPAWVERWMRLFSTRMANSANVGGTFALNASHDPADGDGWTGSATCQCSLPRTTSKAATAWTVHLGHLSPSADALSLAATSSPKASPAGESAEAVPAEEPVSGTLNPQGTVFRYTSTNTARQLAQAIPALADALPAILTGPSTATRPWTGGQTWAAATTSDAPPARTHRRQHRR